MDAGAVRRAPRPARRVPVRARRGGHVEHRAAREALAPARLPGRGRPLGRLRLLPADRRRRPGDHGRPAGPEVERDDPLRARAPTPRSTSSGASAPGRSRRPSARPRHARPTAARGSRRSRPPRRRTTRAASPPSSASSGRRTPAATTCTATWSSATTRRRPLQVEPYTTMKPLGSDDPVDLWKWMAAFEQKTGGDVLAIAHNGNLSNGQMFPMVEAFGRKIDRAYAEERAKWERLYEVDADQGDRRGAPLPLAERRVRRLRALGQGQPRRQRRQEEGHAAVRVRPLGAQERPHPRAEARREPLQVRHGRQHRRPHRPRRDGGGELLRQDRAPGARAPSA